MRNATRRILPMLIGAIIMGWSHPLMAQDRVQDGAPTFELGPVFADFGPHVAVPGVAEFPADAAFQHSFDVADGAEGDARNRGFESAARFVNMHAAAGVAPDNIRVAVVVHGSAVRDLLHDDARAARDLGKTNPSGAMVRAMLDGGVRFIVCGQSLISSGYRTDELIPGVEIALSAMTAHAQLQQQGYTVNPF
ncbi:MAG: DsrE family protein [Pontixanthobacter sp.]